METKNNSKLLSELVAKATGPLPYNLTNDYLFRALLQENNKVLKGLIGSLLHLQPEEIISAEIKNPIILGESIGDKDFVLDVHVLLNDEALIDLEMQVLKYDNWNERSLGYLCRTFDNLNKGDDYLDTKPAIHIGFLDFTLFPEYPEFYATYKLMNVRNHTIYSDKIVLSVVNLKQIELATEQDKEYMIDYWAALFKATTWEDIKMIAEKNSCFQDASETLLQLTTDERIREQCEARHAYEVRQRYTERKMANLEEQLASKEEQLAASQEQLAASQEQLAESNAENARLRAELERLKKKSTE